MTFTRNSTTDADPLARQRLYRRLFVGLIVGGAAIAITLREVLGYPLVGEAVYWLAIIAALAVWRGTSVTLFDERDAALERRASHYTLTIVAVPLILGASAARLLSYTDTYAVPSEIWAVLWGGVGLYVLFAGVYLTLRYRG